MLNLFTRARAEAGLVNAFALDATESLRIQTLRGLACLLLVSFHAIGSKMTSGLQVENDSVYREFANIFVHMRMPLFTFLSGFVYAYRPLLRFHEQTFVIKKLRRLALPLIVATTLTYVMHVLLNDRSKRPTLDDAWQIYVFPYEHFWFVQALLLIFAALVLLESSGALRTFPRFLCVLAAATVLHLYPPFAETSLFSIREASYLLPHFLLGLGANRFRAQLQSRAIFYVALACFIPAQAWHTFSVISSTPPPINTDLNRTVLGLVIGMSATLCALQLIPFMSWGSAIGKRSYPIYLYHPIFVAGFRIIVGQIHGVPVTVMFAGCLTAGIIGPLLMTLLAQRVPGAPLLLEGKTRARPAAIGPRELSRAKHIVR
jgi:peptidoglycan/LPS O-acetylase OafA/YrhL